MESCIGWWFLCSLTEDERNLWTSICQVFWKKFQKFIRNLINWSFLISKPSVYEIQNHQPIPYNIHTRSDLNSRPCIWEKRNNRIKDPEPLKFCRRFERFAANLVGCLSVKDYRFQYLWTRVTEGKFANQRPFKTACINFWSGSFIRLFRFSHIQNERLPFKLKF